MLVERKNPELFINEEINAYDESHEINLTERNFKFAVAIELDHHHQRDLDIDPYELIDVNFEMIHREPMLGDKNVAYWGLKWHYCDDADW